MPVEFKRITENYDIMEQPEIVDKVLHFLNKKKKSKPELILLENLSDAFFASNLSSIIIPNINNL